MARSPHDLIVIRTFADGISAAIARAALEAHDIPALVLCDDVGGLHPALTFAQGVRLAVQHVDAVRAIRVLDVGAEEPRSTWRRQAPLASTDGDLSGPPAA